MSRAALARQLAVWQQANMLHQLRHRRAQQACHAAILAESRAQAQIAQTLSEIDLTRQALTGVRAGFITVAGAAHGTPGVRRHLDAMSLLMHTLKARTGDLPALRREVEHAEEVRRAAQRQLAAAAHRLDHSASQARQCRRRLADWQEEQEH